MDYSDISVSECLIGSDGEMLCFALDRARKEFAWKTGGLDAAQLRHRHPPSTMTLAGLIKHLAFVEDWFTAMAQGRPTAPSEDQHAYGARNEWESALTDEPDALYMMWYDAVERSRKAWAQMIIDGLDVIVEDPDPAWNKNRRRVLVDLLEENLIHLGHVDLLRESIDGRRGHGLPEQ